MGTHGVEVPEDDDRPRLVGEGGGAGGLLLLKESATLHVSLRFTPLPPTSPPHPYLLRLLLGLVEVTEDSLNLVLGPPVRVGDPGPSGGGFRDGHGGGRSIDCGGRGEHNLTAVVFVHQVKEVQGGTKVVLVVEEGELLGVYGGGD